MGKQHQTKTIKTDLVQLDMQFYRLASNFRSSPQSENMIFAKFPDCTFLFGKGRLDLQL